MFILTFLINFIGIAVLSVVTITILWTFLVFILWCIFAR